MAAVTGITLVKKFSYRGDATEEYSNTYHFDVPVPSNSTTWKIVVDALATAEALCLPTGHTIVQAYGYGTDVVTDPSVFGWNYVANGDTKVGVVAPPGDGQKLAGDQAVFLWGQLDHKNTKGRYVYLRKYLHGGYALAADPDKISATYHTPLQAFVDKLVAGTITECGHWRARTGTWPVIAHGVGPYVTTRTLERRGKKKRP